MSIVMLSIPAFHLSCIGEFNTLLGVSIMTQGPVFFVPPIGLISDKSDKSMTTATPAITPCLKPKGSVLVAVHKLDYPLFGMYYNHMKLLVFYHQFSVNIA